MYKNIIKQSLNWLIPARCLICRGIILQENKLCPLCWSHIIFISNNHCSICGLPFSIDLQDNEAECANCTKEKPYFDRARAAVLYDSHSKQLILQFKHCDATHIAKMFADWMLRAGADIMQETQYLVPIPLHWRRLFFRKYNQSSLLAKFMGKIAQQEVLYHLLKRKKHNKTQSGLTKQQRQENIKNVFYFNEKFTQIIKQKVLTIIDDVHTSGATVNACSKLLKQHGAKKVNVITFARVAQL